MNHSSIPGPVAGPQSRARLTLRRGAVALAASVALVLVAVSPAAATWSIVAVDPETGDVGAAMAACSPVSALGEADEVPAPLILVPGRGAAVAQGSIDPTDLAQLRSVLTESAATDAGAVIADVVADNDPDLQSGRQYAVVVGESVASVGGDQPGSIITPGPAMSAQGVMVTSDAVVDDAAAAYRRARDGGAPLADALVEALLAGSEAGGDLGCGEQTALFAHVAVAAPGDDGQRPARLLTVTVDEGDGQNPVELLAEAHRSGRTGWVDAGRRPAVTIPRWIVLVVALAMGAAAVAVIRHGLGYRRPAAR